MGQQLTICFKERSTITFDDLHTAYLHCRVNKRQTASAQTFEREETENLTQLVNDINNNTYTIGQSIAFIVDKPVTREIFAAAFRDRIIHHWIIDKLNPLFEKEFIYDSYSCREGRGTLFAVNRVDRFIRSCSQNYQKDTYVLKLDIRGFFMSISKDILWNKLQQFIKDKYLADDQDLMLELVEQVVMNDCTHKCYIKSPRWKWKNLPTDKSLFNRGHVGIPIGNLTSQVFANFYLTCFDHFMKSTLGLKYYGRYVDDFFVIHNDKQFLLSLIPKVEAYLKDELHLTLHPKKRQIGHCKRGMKFVGTFLLPNRTYTDKRTKGNFYRLIAKWNRLIESRAGKNCCAFLNKEETDHFQASFNSYCGFLRHHKTYKLRKKMYEMLSPHFAPFFVTKNDYTKIEHPQAETQRAAKNAAKIEQLRKAKGYVNNLPWPHCYYPENDPYNIGLFDVQKEYF
ncbi:MAG: hypothetical protein LBN93_05830 [Candidatus Symbiothrix sp.]|jgi:retron-type reverse transcriptase|nr:hypothetical protein [Candidatus Symbiothrix sp.]